MTGMTCSACSSRVEKMCVEACGVDRVSVNLLTNSMQVEYDETVLNERQIVDAVVKAGYGARNQAADASVSSQGNTGKKAESVGNVMEEQLRNMKMRLIVSFGF